MCRSRPRMASSSGLVAAGSSGRGDSVLEIASIVVMLGRALARGAVYGGAGTFLGFIAGLAWSLWNTGYIFEIYQGTDNLAVAGGLLGSAIALALFLVVAHSRRIARMLSNLRARVPGMGSLGRILQLQSLVSHPAVTMRYSLTARRRNSLQVPHCSVASVCEPLALDDHPSGGCRVDAPACP